MKIRFYGRLAEAIAPQIELDLGERLSVGEVRRRLAAENPSAAATLGNRRAVACINHLVVGDDHVISADDVVEFLPPVSGG